MALMVDHCSLFISYLYVHVISFFSLAGEDIIASFAGHRTKPYFYVEGVSYIFNIAVNWPITISFNLSLVHLSIALDPEEMCPSNVGKLVKIFG